MPEARLRRIRRLSLLVAALAFGAILAIGTPTSAQGDLSSQVLRLLSRVNTWTALQTFSNGMFSLTSASGAPTTTTDRLYNIGGSLYWNGSVVTTAAGVGTVTSVGLSAPAEITVGGTPVTSSGTLALSWTAAAANRVFAAPSGLAGTPTFRALVDLDVPDTITIDGASNVTWASVNKAGSSLADFATRSASDLSSGALSLGLLTDGGTAGVPLVSGGGGGASYSALDLSNPAVTANQLAAARMPAFTGDITTAAGSVATSLSTTGVTAASYGSASAIPIFTVDAKGRITTASSTSVSSLNLLSAGHPDTVVGTVARGAMIVGNSTPKWALYQPSVAGCVFGFDGSDTSCTTSGGGLTALNAGNISTGTLAVARGGSGTGTLPTNGQLLIGNGTSYTLSGLTGTANQIVVTNGVGSITLSTPQGIATSSTPQFARLGLGTGAGGSAVLTLAGVLADTTVAKGNLGATATFDLSAGRVQSATLTANCVFTASNPIAGARYVFLLTQDGTGSRTVTWFAGIKWEGAAAPTLTTTAAHADRVDCLYDGTSYYCAATLNFN